MEVRDDLILVRDHLVELGSRDIWARKHSQDLESDVRAVHV